ncbi:BRO family protein [Sutterella wadsworthensis]|uniref:BRO family protein n=1 Tax=Sutterella wadsworthensis TaxID=40545 RepID=UPI0024310A71|nr:BRO family protein [Sutterella wadsworthensis]
MSALTFSFENSSVRTLGTPEAPLFVATDICKALSHSNPRKAIADLVDPEDIVKAEITDSMGRTQTVNCVTESGLYALIFGSKLESAKRFKRWVTSEVLPAIRKQGFYAGPDYINEAQQREIQKAVGRRAAGIGKNFSLIYGALKDRFDIPRYTCLQKRDFEAALDFIQKAPIMSREQWLQKEESERKRIEATTYRDERIPERIPAFYLTDAEAKNLLAGIYCLRYLFRPQIQAFYNTLNQMKSPLAAQFYEFFTCMHLYFIENDLSKHGYRMEDLPCYRHWLAHQPA